MLAQHQHRDLLADQLAWGEQAARFGRVPLKFIRDRVQEALAVALGEIPLGVRTAREVAA